MASANSVHMVVTVGSEPSSMSGLARGSTNEQELVSADSVPGGMTLEVGESTAGVDSSSRTPKRRTLELAVRIGRRPMCVLVDSRSTGNYIDARECIARRIKIDAEDQAEELKMADGILVKLRDEFSLCSSVVGIEVKFLPAYFPI